MIVCVMVCTLAVIPMSALAQPPAGPPPKPMVSASFEGDLEDWTLQLNRGAQAELSYPEDAAWGRRCLRIAPTLLCAPDDIPATTNIHVYRERFRFEPGKRYALSCWAKAEVARRPMVLAARRADAAVSLGSTSFEATSYWRRFERVFTVSEPLEDVRLQVIVGGDERPVMIDCVALRELPGDAEFPADYIAHGREWAQPGMWSEGEVAADPEAPSVSITGTALFGVMLPPSFTLHMVMRSEGPATVLVGPDTADVNQFELPGGEAVTVRCERRAGGDEPLPERLRLHVAGGPVQVLSMAGYEMLPPRPDTGATEREEGTDPETGARIVRLTHSPYEDKHAYYDVDPWSPDGSQILFCSALPGQAHSSIWIMESDGTDIRKVGESDSFSYHIGNFPLWSHDGESVYWRGYRATDGGREFGTVRHFLADGREEFLPFGVRQVSPTGQLLDTISVADVAPCGLYVSDADGSNRRLIASMDAILALSPSRALVAEQGLALNLQNCKWNADGSRCFVVFAGRDERGRAAFVEVYSVDADGSDLTFSCAIAHHPIWHPDGERILFNAADGMYLVNWDGTGLRKVSDCNLGHPSFSRDGAMIVTDGYGADMGDALWLIDPETGATTKLCTVPNVHGRTHERGTQPHPVWSPDGHSVLYDSDETGHCQLYQAFVPE